MCTPSLLTLDCALLRTSTEAFMAGGRVRVVKVSPAPSIRTGLVGESVRLPAAGKVPGPTLMRSRSGPFAWAAASAAATDASGVPVQFGSPTQKVCSAAEDAAGHAASATRAAAAGIGPRIGRDYARLHRPANSNSVTAENGIDYAYHDAGESEIELPVFVANGDSDPMILPGYSHLLAGFLPDARLTIYPDSAHGFLFQHHRQFAADVNAFLAEAD